MDASCRRRCKSSSPPPFFFLLSLIVEYIYIYIVRAYLAVRV